MLVCITRTVILAGRHGARPLSHETCSRALTLHQVLVKSSDLCGIDLGWVQSHIDSARRNTTGTEKVAPLDGQLVAKMVVHNLSKTDQGQKALSCTKSPDHLCPSAGGFASCSKILRLSTAVRDTLKYLDNVNSDRSKKIYWKFVSKDS